MIDTTIKNKSSCTGCGVCANVCEFNAIKMKQDTEGFLYPSVDYSLCKKCRKCIAKCPSIQDKDCKLNPECYAIYSKDTEAKRASSSGGCFNLLAKYILSNGGAVCGASFNENWTVEHIIIDKYEDLQKIQTSKYLQSIVYNIFPAIREFLSSGKPFLFSGTPCQVNALRTYLGKDYDNLFLVDIICHGVPSPMVWEKYLNSVAKNNPVTNVNFRDKTNGWKTFSMRIDSTNNSYMNIFPNDPYMKLFLDNLILRPSCYACSNKDLNRFADITIGDFWGIDNYYPDLNDNTGISALIVYTEKGRKLFDTIKDSSVYKAVDLEQISAGNSAYYSSVAKPQYRDKIMLKLSKKSRIDFESIIKSCNKTPFLLKVKRKIKQLLHR